MGAELKPGNELLREVFPQQWAVTYDNEMLDPPPQVVSSQGHRTFRSLKFPKDGTHWDPSDESENSSQLFEFERKVETEFGQRGVHALAWYLPYRYHGPKRWGIYFDVARMDAYARLLHRAATDVERTLPYEATLRFAYATVTRHELEHAVHEIALAQALRRDGRSHGAATMRQRMDPLETLATQMELLDSPSRALQTTARYRQLLFAVWAVTPKPYPYSAWNERAVGPIEGDFLKSLQLADPDLLNVTRRNVGPRGSTSYIQIPRYRWINAAEPLIMTGAGLRVTLDCGKVERWLRRSELKNSFGVPVSIEPGSKHRLKISTPNTTRPITFGCHDWDRVPDAVVGQLSNAFGVSRQELMRRLSIEA